jgi:hypothetical protein
MEDEFGKKLILVQTHACNSKVTDTADLSLVKEHCSGFTVFLLLPLYGKHCRTAVDWSIGRLDKLLQVYKDCNRQCSSEKKNTGRESAWRQDEMIGGKPPVVK